MRLFKCFKLTCLALFLCISSALSAKVYLVAVAVNDYTHFPGGNCSNLTLSIKDATDVAKLYGKNTTTEYSLLTDKQATKARVKRAIVDVLGKAQANDIVVFYFSGHGYPGGFCVYDGEMNYSQIRKALTSSKCKNKMMFIDSCHSGAMRSNSNHSSQNAQAKKSNVMLFLSSRDSEVSTENRRMRNGTFTAFLLKGLKGNADANRDRTITARELYNYVHSQVLKESDNEQHPVMWGKFNDNMPVMKW